MELLLIILITLPHKIVFAWINLVLMLLGRRRKKKKKKTKREMTNTFNKFPTKKKKIY